MTTKQAAAIALEPNWKNKTLFIGDNLHVMRRMNSGLIDLIYLDPPFNSNRTYVHAVGKHKLFDDIWRESDMDVFEHLELANYSGEKEEDKLALFKHARQMWKEDNISPLYKVIAAAKAAHGSSMFSYLIFMTLRLIEMHRLLKETGSIYLHCDPTANAYLRLIMDAIFGKENFRNEIIWSYRTGGSSKRYFSRKHDTILCYGKSRQDDKTQRDPRFKTKFNPQKEKSYTKAKGRKPGKINYGGGTAEFYEDDCGVFNWVNARDVWEISYVGSTDKERTGYSTQKPDALLERIIKASSNEGDIVFDPFCGCATTMVCAEKLRRQWAGIDILPQARSEIQKRMVKLAIARGENEMFFCKSIIHRDLSGVKIHSLQRTDQGKLPHYRTHKDKLYGLQGGYCGYPKHGGGGCGQHFEKRNMEVDHIVPTIKGGTHHYSNLQLLCGACNKLKRDNPQAFLEAQLEKQGITLTTIQSMTAKVPKIMSKITII